MERAGRPRDRRLTRKERRMALELIAMLEEARRRGLEREARRVLEDLCRLFRRQAIPQ